MSLLDGLLQQSIIIDFNSDPWYGSDQIFNTYPIRFATVQFQLIDTEPLVKIADRIRIDYGFRPMLPVDKFRDNVCDQNCWYDFYIGINDLPDQPCDKVLSFVVANSDQDDNEREYLIVLTKSEQEALYTCLNEQCKKHLGKSCAELLQEAKAEMMS